VGHNTSKQKRREIEQDCIVAEFSQWLVPEWQVDRSRLQIVTIDTVLGHCQRSQEVLLRCRKRDCHRRVEVDLRGEQASGGGVQVLIAKTTI
jgi:hypothetical protein